ncbi:MAG: 2-amino-4-hydroxy-6-hydroxymethyldihydropteridine diphosphokinase, partial [Alphaproteobacteria bacterium RIFOXYD12_FULL_60_8]
MIFIGIGSNLSSSLGGPRATCEAALALLEAEGIAVLRCSSWYESAPVPASDQPWFVNGVADVATNRSAQDLLACLLSIETKLGRERTTPN